MAQSLPGAIMTSDVGYLLKRLYSKSKKRLTKKEARRRKGGKK